MAFGFPPSEEQASYYDLSEEELAQVIKITVNLLEWGIVNRQGNELEVRTESAPMSPGDKVMITIKERGGVQLKSTAASSFPPFDGGRNRRNIQMFLGELSRQVKMYQRKKK